MKDSKIKVLYIDDEDNNLNSFRASLRKDFEVLTAIDAETGFDLVRKNKFHVVIADQRMPGLTGVEFFEKMMEIDPDPIRILLTGYSDIASVIDAINKGEVYRFIDKPWNLEQIKNAIRNAGEIFETKRELREMNQRLTKVYSEMNQFVYSLSHELRGPLMSISSVSKLAKSEITDPAQMEYFDMIDIATEKLDDYIHKMLDFYRCTKLENKITTISFQQILDEQLAAYHGKWDLSDFDITIDIDQNEPFYSDDSKIRVILNNLFGNAYQFQHEGDSCKKIGVTVRVANELASIEISDNGIGISANLQEEVFNLFQKATQKNVGSGLGLYMVKESVSLLGGKIKLHSDLGNGTQIVVELPSLTSTSI